MRNVVVGQERAGWRRGGGGAFILMLLIGVAIILIMMFGNFGGNQSYMQNVAGAKHKGEDVAVQLVADQLMTMIVQYKLTNDDKLPQTFDDLQTSPEMFLDPWKKPVRFQYDKSGSTTTLIVISDGPDGQPGTEDDIRYEKPLPV